jgi:LacI family transcriptional regulator
MPDPDSAPDTSLRGPSRVRLAEVARRAGVSKSTASRVLNHDPTLSVRPGTRERVAMTAQELGYRPHPLARALAASTTGALALLVPELSNPAYVELIRGAYGRARERDFVLLCAEDFDAQEADEAFTQLVAAGRVDGLLIASARPAHRLRAALERHWVPHVFVNRSVPGATANVTLDVPRASRAALTHLVDLGHVRVAHVAGPQGVQSARLREEAFVRAARERGLPSAPVARGAFTEAGGAAAATRLLRRHPETTAIYSSSLAQAVGVLHAAREAGLAVPDDLSVIAYDDVPLASYLAPPLTTIAMPLAELGEAAVDALLDLLAGVAPTSRTFDAEPEVVARASTAAPRQR